jgi:carbon-monoxide dehydrogenase large subunit
MGLTFDAGGFAQYMERALEIAQYDQFAARRAQAQARGRLRGIGIANYVESPVGAPKERVELAVSGAGVEIRAGTQSSGQGHETTFAQVLADQLGIAPEKIRLRTGDTRLVAGGGTHSDRSLRLAGTLIVRAAARLIEQARQAAASALEAPAADLVYEAGRFRIAGTDRSIALLDLAKITALSAAEALEERIPAYPAGAAVCEVEVDPETGAVEVVRYATVDDVGRAVNPMIVDGQTHGGIAQGIGQALAEGVAFDATGQLLTGSFLDYGLPRAMDLPLFACELAEDPTPGNALRIKGGGEGGIVPATAAVINALCSALQVDDVPMPATAQTVWAIIGGTRREDR